ncbi:hypothetical protein ACFLU5_07155 [Bacteroidota bacterium]
MKKLLYIVLFLIAAVAFDINAQELKYKDIYPLIESRDFSDAVPRLREFLQQEPDHPSANFQLALIYERRYKSYDLIMQHKPAMKNAENAKLLFLNAQMLIDDREIKKNGKKFYTNFARLDERGKLTVEYQNVKDKIDSAYVEIDQFIRNSPNIYHYFTKSVQFHDKVTKRFADINGRYTSLKSLYLLYDRDLKKSMQDLKEEYDSCLFYFNKYMEATAAYPIVDYNQTFEIRKINNYRLDGLMTKNDFLGEKIIFWDYKSWVDEVEQMITSDIAELRNQINLNEDKLDASIRILEKPSSAIGREIELKEVDRDLVLKLRNYDYNSMVTPLLLYKDSKQNLLYKALAEFELEEDTTQSITYENQLTYYSQMINLSREGDSLVNLVTVLNKPDNYAKHTDYFKTYYNGESGFNTFISREKSFVEDKVKEYAQQIQNTILENLNIEEDSSQFITHGKVKIPFYLTALDSITIPDNSIFTTHINYNQDSTYYLAGVTRPKSDSNNVVVFVSKVNKVRETEWFRTIDVEIDTIGPDSHNTVASMIVTSVGCILTINSMHMISGVMMNTIKVISETGDETFSKRIEEEFYPRSLSFNEQSNSYLITFKGTDIIEDIVMPEPLVVIRLDKDGEVLWRKQTMISGNVEDLINIKGGFLVVGNFSEISMDDGTTVSLNGELGQTNTYVLKIDWLGNMTEKKLFQSDRPFYTRKIIKVNDENINLLGYRGNFSTRPFGKTEGEEIVHIITNAGLYTINSNHN